MKICTVCNEEKTEDEFYKNGFTKDQLQSQCKSCDTKLARIRRRERKGRLIIDLGGKCTKCGYDKCITALEFHHPNDDKEGGVSELLGKSYEQAKEEAIKCQLVCANCHREIHDTPLPIAVWNRKDVVRHGTTAGYRRCPEKCDRCRQAWNKYHRNIRKNSRLRMPSSL